ncbi:hypothetical protein MNBD_GAMMA08-1143 [hydrothermal vent metagenome]|uniref:Uncharacterized protein n=1 Tax=hydrothermal vent metagenome TaxID=652676 RepID=A0A3B0Y603_9ZZZZ
MKTPYFLVNYQHTPLMFASPGKMRFSAREILSYLHRTGMIDPLEQTTERDHPVSGISCSLL